MLFFIHFLKLQQMCKTTKFLLNMGIINFGFEVSEMSWNLMALR